MLSLQLSASRWWIHVFMASMMTLGSLAGTEYHVAITGDDRQGDGSQTRPWATLQKACDAVVPGDTILMHAGVYRQAAILRTSGTADAPITIRCFSDDTVILNGCDLIPPGAWQPGDADRKRFWRAPVMMARPDFERQVFIDGRMATLARWPNDPHPYDGVFSLVWQGGKAITDKEGRPTGITDRSLGQPDGHWRGGFITFKTYGAWAVASARIIDSDSKSNSLVFEPGHVTWHTPKVFFISNTLNALDLNSEWYYDEGRQELFLTDRPAASSPIEYRVRTWGLTLEKVSHVHVHGLRFFATALRAEEVRQCRLTALDAQYTGHFAHMYQAGGRDGHGPVAKDIVDQASDTAFSHALLTYRNYGFHLGGRDNEISGCRMRYAAGPVLIVAGERNLVFNNDISHGCYGPFSKCEAGALLVYGRRHLISHNTLHHAGRAVLSGEFQDCRIQFNELHSGNLYCEDSALFYGGVHDWGNTEFHHNVMKVMRATGYGLHAFYLDDQSSNGILYRNLVLGASHAMRLKGEYHHVYNNSFASRIRNGDLKFYSAANNIDGDVSQFAFFDTTALKGRHPTLKTHLAIDPAALSVEGLRLREGSTAIDSGKVIQGITDGFLGQAPDVGAIEHGQNLWRFGCDAANPPERPRFTTTWFPGRNLVANAGFELANCLVKEIPALDGWDVQGSGRAEAPYSRLQQRCPATATTRSGQRGCVLSGPVVLSQTITHLNPDADYTFRAFVHHIEGEGTVTASVAGHGIPPFDWSAPKGVWGCCESKVRTGSACDRVTITFTVPTGCRAAVDDVAFMGPPPSQPPPDTWHAFSGRSGLEGTASPGQASPLGDPRWRTDCTSTTIRRASACRR
jgi:hypothetical protein